MATKPAVFFLVQSVTKVYVYYQIYMSLEYNQVFPRIAGWYGWREFGARGGQACKLTCLEKTPVTQRSKSIPTSGEL